MSVKLIDRDYRGDGSGGLLTADGAEEILSEVLFRLTARRGAFPLLPELGSEMHRLRGAKPSERQALAREYAVDALADLEDVAVTDAEVTGRGDGLAVKVELTWQGEPLAVEWEESV